MKSTKSQFIFVIFLLFKLSNQETCHFENAEGTVDLSPLKSSDPFQSFVLPPAGSNETSYTVYYFHPCSDTKTIPNPYDNATNECSEGSGYSLCKVDFHEVNGTKWTNHTIQGTNADGKLSYSEGSPYITYGAKDGIVVNLVCVMNFSRLDATTFEYRNPALYLYTPYACLRPHVHDSSHSVGGVLLLILGIFLLVYFIGGYFFKYYAYGARGIEAFPHSDFWTNLPGLVRDGIKFIGNGCRPVQTDDAYEQI